MFLKQILKDSFFEVLENIEPSKLITNKCTFKDNQIIINQEKISLPENKKIHLFGSGKAVLSMAESIYNQCENKIQSSILVGPYDNYLKENTLQYIKSTHPTPSRKSLEAATTLQLAIESLTKDDFFIYLLSGGSSALVELPSDGISIEDFKNTTDIMLKGSMPIEAMNCVRKHLSKVKGGNLSLNSKAKGIVLVLSDVLSNNFEDIGSAPLYFDSSTFNDAISFLKKYNLLDKIPSSVKKHLLLGVDGNIEETPKKQNENIKHFLIASNEILLQDIKSKLSSKNIPSMIMDTKIEKDVQIVVKDILNFIDSKEEGCFILGGEALVQVTQNGKGGRNQHLILSLLEKFPKNKNLTILSAASDGIDGNSNSAGAIIDNESLDKANLLQLDIQDYLNNFNSNVFFEKIDGLITTGPSHNNMLDVLIIHIRK